MNVTDIRTRYPNPVRVEGSGVFIPGEYSVLGAAVLCFFDLEPSVVRFECRFPTPSDFSRWLDIPLETAVRIANMTEARRFEKAWTLLDEALTKVVSEPRPCVRCGAEKARYYFARGREDGRVCLCLACFSGQGEWLL